MKFKDEVFDCVVQYVNACENLTEKNIKRLRCDNVTEYFNGNIYVTLLKKGVLLLKIVQLMYMN